MTANQKNVMKQNKQRIQMLGATLAGIRMLLDKTSGELHAEAYGKMKEDPEEVRIIDEASISLFHACEYIDQACGSLEATAGGKK